jgi:hypothetical protein
MAVFLMRHLFSLGWAVLAGGLAIEVVAFLGMGYYPIRRALPVKSPLQLQAFGCMLFYAGFVLLVLASLARHWLGTV